MSWGYETKQGAIEQALKECGLLPSDTNSKEGLSSYDGKIASAALRV